MAVFSLGRGAVGLDAQGMNVVFHQVSDGHIYESVTSHCGESIEFVRNDTNTEVPLAVASPLVSNVQVAFIDYFEFFGLKGLDEPGPDFDDALFVHGRTLLNGLTVTSR